MIQAKVTSLSPVQVTGLGLPMPQVKDYRNMADYDKDYLSYLDSEFIADVENDKMILHGLNYEPYEAILVGVTYRNISLNQQVFIELTGEGKCKIVKI